MMTAVALLGALVADLPALLAAAPALREYGLVALGPVPTLRGIATCPLLPLLRGLRAGLSAATDHASLEAGETLGMVRAPILARIALPQGASTLIGAFRIATAQSIELATLGAGGPGRIVFDRVAQYAPNRIPLGASAIAQLAWLAESAVSAREARPRPVQPQASPRATSSWYSDTSRRPSLATRALSSSLMTSPARSSRFQAASGVSLPARGTYLFCVSFWYLWI